MKRYVLTLQSITNSKDYYTFRFDKPNGLSFEPGQYGVFLHVDKDIEGRRMRAFTFASDPTDKVLEISTIIVDEPSDFKAKMKALQPGDTMTVDGPMGRFTLDPDEEAVFITTGIGITPVASIATGRIPKPMTLHYHEAEDNHLYTDRFDNEHLTVHLYSSLQEMTSAIKHNHNIQAMYYISGPMSFVGKITELLQTIGIDKDHMKSERFTGY
ncbi:FAD-dependent oxidoreductase [Candidatus Xianfuyuplasma coldseepsis]|uniref:FAD-dependent oxidoreductase n=1 Tax=Candidatus Xianfuyuplasma coldseepsis TaxID=2782163 RepID=A0A7L7KPD5_9MOLU|nr:FAD-dependent oxidoreductase [Xianfuyuplasma coldseepsis]QMS84553.1 FAD-dependent oxidoreductase [Xianfuyuplasma coldseepsis]